MELSSEFDKSSKGAVIWISGYSASGKTTVGRIVRSRLKSAGHQVIYLDGDDLRSILGNKWGYERGERVELARAYFRLCSHLASQGAVVVISAVALYSEARKWLVEHVPNSIQFFLNVPNEELIRRDKKTKNIYSSIDDVKNLYDPPTGDGVIIIDNFGANAPELTAERVVKEFSVIAANTADFGRNEHWGSYYSQNIAPQNPSPFATHVKSLIDSRHEGGGVTIIDIGCGNGRDALYFDSTGLNVFGIDRSEAAIEACRKAAGNATFIHGTIDAVKDRLPSKIDAIYSRFVIHAMPLEEEIALLKTVESISSIGTQLFIECRSINDPMARLGEVISPTERIHGHYRRFIVKEELLERLQSVGYEALEVTEADNLAKYGEDNPVVIRVHAVKRA